MNIVYVALRCEVHTLKKITLTIALLPVLKFQNGARYLLFQSELNLGVHRNGVGG
jgi:hypothetical protein